MSELDGIFARELLLKTALVDGLAHDAEHTHQAPSLRDASCGTPCNAPCNVPRDTPSLEALALALGLVLTRTRSRLTLILTRIRDRRSISGASSPTSTGCHLNGCTRWLARSR